MIFRSLVVCTFVVGNVLSGNAAAQVLYCPETPSETAATADAAGEAETLLKRLTIALDLHGHRGISEHDIMGAHTDTPSALLEKLINVANSCRNASGDFESFHAALPELRRAFLAATSAEAVSSAEQNDEAEVQSASLARSGTEDLEQSIDLSIRELWRKLWFRPGEADKGEDARWAVIVASPEDVDSGWDMLGAHQRKWKDAYFELHEPYYRSNPYHAIVVGRRLPRDQASKLRDYVIELGMASDTYLWRLPDGERDGAESPPPPSERQSDIGAAEVDGVLEGSGYRPERKLDLSILEQ